jgi:predicted nuclease with RNAse H fold
MREEYGLKMLPPSSGGAAIGIDVGWSLGRRSSAICRLEWDTTTIRWIIARFRAIEPERSQVIASITGSAPILVAALDGPLRRGLDEIGHYRAAERMLTKRLRLIGKPGQSSSPVGRLLNRHANLCAKELLGCAALERATHQLAIHERAIVEAFPSAFLGLMLADPSAFTPKRGDRSDVYFASLADAGGFAALLARLLPGRSVAAPIGEIHNHDDRAAFVCALTALCVATGEFTAVGDAADGWIILPPRAVISGWGWSALMANAAVEQQGALYAPGGIKG